MENPICSEVRVRFAKSLFNVRDRQMNSRRDDVARRFVFQLNEVLAKIGLDNIHARRFEAMIEADFLRHHRLALGDEAGAGFLADRQNCRSRLIGRCGPMNFRAGLRGAFLERFKIMVEMR